MTSIIITAIICTTLVVLSFISKKRGKNDDDKR